MLNDQHACKSNSKKHAQSGRETDRLWIPFLRRATARRGVPVGRVPPLGGEPGAQWQSHLRGGKSCSLDPCSNTMRTFISILSTKSEMIERRRGVSRYFLYLRLSSKPCSQPSVSHHPPTSNLEPARGPTCGLQSPLLRLQIASQSQLFYRATFRFPRGHLDSAAPGPSVAAAACILRRDRISAIHRLEVQGTP